MSLEADPRLDDHLESKSSTSPIAARSRSSPSSQPLRIANGKIMNDESIEPMSIGAEEVQPSPTFIQGVRLHLLTLGYQHLRSWAMYIWIGEQADNH